MISLSAITSCCLSAALVATWVMQVTTHQAGLGSSIARLALAQRIALAALAIFLMLNAVTPFITPDPPWLANPPPDSIIRFDPLAGSLNAEDRCCIADFLGESGEGFMRRGGWRGSRRPGGHFAFEAQ